jgi:alanyl-tRNA synthetase
VLDVQKNNDGYLHFTDKLPENPKGSWFATVDQERRFEIEKHHTATHLMHAALRNTLGDHVAQKGSLVADDRLRFDFSHFEAVDSDALNEIEELVNEKIQQNIPLQEERDVPLEEARKKGAMMLFGEKYGDKVRIVTFDEEFSVELCGGTHVSATGKIGYFRFLHETSVAAGIRRVEAVVGKRADHLLRNEKMMLDRVRLLLESRENPVADIERLLDEKKRLEKELDRLQQKQASGRLDELLHNSESVGGVSFVSGEVSGADMDTLKQMGYDALEKKKVAAVTVLGSANPANGKVFLMAAITPDLVKKGLKAGSLVGELGKVVGGGGGGQPNLATAGGRFPEKLEEALKKAKTLIENQLKG